MMMVTMAQHLVSQTDAQGRGVGPHTALEQQARN